MVPDINPKERRNKEFQTKKRMRMIHVVDLEDSELCNVL
jgi:hypothetical protein